MTILNRCVTGFPLPLYLHDTLNICLPAKRKNEANFPCVPYMDLNQDRIGSAEALRQRLIKPEKS